MLKNVCDKFPGFTRGSLYCYYSHISIIWLIIWVNFDRFRWPLIIWVSYHLTEFFFFKFKTYHYFIIFQNFWISAHRALTLQAQSRFWKRVHTEIYKFYQNFIIWLSWFLLKNTLIIWVSYHMSKLCFSRLRRGFIIWLSYHMTELRL